ncbi:DEAD-box ATP-dependent RNA helicase 27 [Sesbania bispinosa]|nr:DEAD-box ATP-dependent RNA helicase 27 [Sesbania bispinosa]
MEISKGRSAKGIQEIHFLDSIEVRAAQGRGNFGGIAREIDRGTYSTTESVVGLGEE